MMKFQDLPFDIHSSLVEYLYVPDLISLSETSTALRQFYFKPSWKRCVVSDLCWSPEVQFTHRHISKKALVDKVLTSKVLISRALTRSPDAACSAASIQNIKSVIREIKLRCGSVPSIDSIDPLDYPALRLMNIFPYYDVFDSRDSLKLYSKEYHQKVSESKLLHFDMFRIDHSVTLYVQNDGEVFHAGDSTIFTKNKFLQQGSICLKIDSSEPPSEQHVFCLPDSRPNTISEGLSVMNISSLQINRVDNRTLVRLLDGIQTLPNLSSVEMYAEFYNVSQNRNLIQMWPTPQLMNHKCFSSVERLSLVVEPVHRDLPENPAETVYSHAFGQQHQQSQINLEYVSEIDCTVCIPYFWNNFFQAFSFPKLKDTKIPVVPGVSRMDNFSFTQPIFDNITETSCTLNSIDQLMFMIENLPRLKNLKCLRVEEHWDQLFDENISFHDLLKKRFEVAVSVISGNIVDSAFLNQISDREEKFFRNHLVLFHTIAYNFLASRDKYLDESTVKEIYAKYSSEALVNDQEWTSHGPIIKTTMVSFYLELLFLRAQALCSLTHIELSMANYYDSSQLLALINNHPTLQTVEILVQYEYMWVAGAIKSGETRSFDHAAAKISPSDIPEMCRSVTEAKHTLENLANVPHYARQTPEACFDTFSHTNGPFYNCHILVDVELNRLKRSFKDS